MLNKNLIIILFAVLLPVLNMAQGSTQLGIDTSFTLYSATQKVQREYPFAIPVEKTIPGSVSAEYNIIYSSLEERKLHLDLFSPKVKSKEPVLAVIIIHGGGWRSGNKTMDHHLAINLAANGFTAVTIEYQLSTEALYPAAVLNIKSAIVWLKKNAERLNVNPAKIILMGSSSGGHLAALAGVTAGNEKFENAVLTENTQVAGIINIDGVLDMSAPEESGKDTIPSKPSAAKQWLGYNFRDNPQIWKDASPLNYIDSKTPPILFINSSIPRFHAGRDQVINKMQKFKIYSEVHTIPNTPHPFWLFHPWFDESLKYIIDFLNKF